MSVFCRYHCRTCDAHFTSLEAFDAHHEGSGESLRHCVFPDPEALVELAGVCKISEYDEQTGKPIPQVGVVYEHKRAAKVREHHGRLRGPQAARTEAREAA